MEAPASEYCAGSGSPVGRRALDTEGVYCFGKFPAFRETASRLKYRGSTEPPNPPPSSGGALVRTELARSYHLHMEMHMARHHSRNSRRLPSLVTGGGSLHIGPALSFQAVHLVRRCTRASALPKPHPPRVPVWTFLFPSSPMSLWTLGRIRHEREEESHVNYAVAHLQLAVYALDRHLQFQREQTSGGTWGRDRISCTVGTLVHAADTIARILVTRRRRARHWR